MSRKPKKVYVEETVEEAVDKTVEEKIEETVEIEASGEELEDELDDGLDEQADEENDEESEEESSEEEVTIEASGEETSEEESTEVISDEVIEQIVNQKASLRSKVEAVIFASPKPMKTVEIFELLSDETPAPKKASKKEEVKEETAELSGVERHPEQSEGSQEITEPVELLEEAEDPGSFATLRMTDVVERITLEQVQEELDQLIEFYQDRAGGFTLKYVKRMGYQFQTSQSVREVMEKQFASRPRPLSRASLETLAVVAYRQKKSKGVTRAEVEFIRGVDAGGIFKTLVERGMLHCTGRKEIPGRPLMFVVTDEFLKTFQLSSTDDLPPLESFQIPVETLNAAQEKISAFEAEQEASVNPEKFIGDDTYRDETTAVGDINGPDVPVEAAEAVADEVLSENSPEIEIIPQAVEGDRQGASAEDVGTVDS